MALDDDDDLTTKRTTSGSGGGIGEIIYPPNLPMPSILPASQSAPDATRVDTPPFYMFDFGLYACNTVCGVPLLQMPEGGQQRLVQIEHVWLYGGTGHGRVGAETFCLSKANGKLSLLPTDSLFFYFSWRLVFPRTGSSSCFLFFFSSFPCFSFCHVLFCFSPSC